MRVDQSSGYPPSHVRGRTRGHTVRGSRITGSQQPSDTEKDWKEKGRLQFCIQCCGQTCNSVLQQRPYGQMVHESKTL